MALKTLDHVARACAKAAVSEPQIQQILAYLTKNDRRLASESDDTGWAKLLEPLKVHLRSMKTNQHQRPDYLVPECELYIKVLLRARQSIENAMSEHATLDDALKDRAARRRDNPNIAPGGHRWQDWVPEHVKQDIRQRIELTYAKNGRESGRKFVPFVDVALQKANAMAEKRIRAVIERTRFHASENPNDKIMRNYAPTPFRALLMACARQAERELEDRLKSGKPLPVNWQALLEPDTRRRLREGSQYPANVSPEGLKDFLWSDKVIEQAYRPLDTETAATLDADLKPYDDEEGGTDEEN